MAKTVTWESVKQKRPYDEERLSQLSRAMAVKEAEASGQSTRKAIASKPKALGRSEVSLI